VHYASLALQAVYFPDQPVTLSLHIHVFLHRLCVLVRLDSGTILLLHGSKPRYFFVIMFDPLLGLCL
jgi:hypothetical protein